MLSRSFDFSFSSARRPVESFSSCSRFKISSSTATLASPPLFLSSSAEAIRESISFWSQIFLFLSASISALSSSIREVCEPLRTVSLLILSSQDSMSFWKPKISRRMFSITDARFSLSLSAFSRLPVMSPKAFSFSEIVSVISITFCAAASLSDLIFSIRSAIIFCSSRSSLTPPAEFSNCSRASLYSPSRRILFSLWDTISPSIPLRSATASAKSSEIIFASDSSIFFFSSKDLMFSRSFSISLPRESIPTPWAFEPPVMLPPAFITWPSSVTILNLLLYFFAMAIAESISSQTATLPSKFSIMLWYFLSTETRSDAILTKPYWSWSPFSSRVRVLIDSMGKNVALPPWDALRYSIACLASLGVSTTTFWRAVPRAVSTATEYLSLTVISCERAPWIPRRAPLFCSCITALTEPWYPSIFFSISSRIRTLSCFLWISVSTAEISALIFSFFSVRVCTFIL